VKALSEFCTNLHSSFATNPPATEKKLNEAVKSFVTRSDVENIVESLPLISDVRNYTKSVITDVQNMIVSHTDDVDESLKLYLTVENFTKILGELTEKMIEKQKERVEAERTRVDKKLQQHAEIAT
jgi:hypothetical protein